MGVRCQCCGEQDMIGPYCYLCTRFDEETVQAIQKAAAAGIGTRVELSSAVAKALKVFELKERVDG